ncbi:MAG: hypothetical protein JSW27_19210 [Phycisphaerales bacterium]|nr:MAG: hypothetical protein JSW27_19210 [Phycisphaerales bacterium]
MKQASVVATVILAVAVLLAAYAIGRLIRQARLDEPPAPPQQVAESNDANEAEAVMIIRLVNRTRQELTPEERARIKEERAERLAQTNNLTDEEKQKLRDDIRQKLRARGGTAGQIPQLAPEELEALARRWPEMSEEEREQAKAAFRARMQAQRSAGLRQPATMQGERPPAPNAPAKEAGAETPTAEPNAAGPN